MEPDEQVDVDLTLYNIPVEYAKEIVNIARFRCDKVDFAMFSHSRDDI